MKRRFTPLMVFSFLVQTALFAQYDEADGFSLAINYNAGPVTIEMLPNSFEEPFEIRQGIRGEMLRSWSVGRHWALVTGATINWFNYQSTKGANGGFFLPMAYDMRQVVVGIPLLGEFAVGDRVQFRVRAGAEPSILALSQRRTAGTNQEYEVEKTAGVLVGVSGTITGQLWVRTTNSTAWFFQAGGQALGFWPTGDGQREWGRLWHIGTGVQWTWK